MQLFLNQNMGKVHTRLIEQEVFGYRVMCVCVHVCIDRQNSHLAPKHTRLIEQVVSGCKVMCVRVRVRVHVRVRVRVCVCVCIDIQNFHLAPKLFTTSMVGLDIL